MMNFAAALAHYPPNDSNVKKGDTPKVKRSHLTPEVRELPETLKEKLVELNEEQNKGFKGLPKLAIQLLNNLN